MTVEPAIITKDARMAPRDRHEPARREGERRGPRFELRGNMRVVAEPRRPRDPPAGSVDLRSLRYPAEASENWEKSTRIQDCVTTVNAAIDEIADCFVEVIGESCGDLGKEIDALAAQVGEITRRLERAEFENATLKRSLELLAQSLGARAAAPPKRKAKAKSSDAGGLPEFVRAAPSKRKTRNTTVEAAPVAEIAP
jgi:hypothetical protein